MSVLLTSRLLNKYWPSTFVMNSDIKEAADLVYSVPVANAYTQSYFD